MPTLEHQLLLLCTRLAGNGKIGKQIKALAEQGPRWDILTAQARAHGVLPLVYTHLHKHAWDWVPPAAQQHLREYTEQNTKKNLRLAGELVRVLAALEQAGIAALPYKGPSLEQEIYRKSGFR